MEPPQKTPLRRVVLVFVSALVLELALVLMPVLVLALVPVYRRIRPPSDTPPSWRTIQPQARIKGGVGGGGARGVGGGVMKGVVVVRDTIIMEDDTAAG